MNRTAYQQAIQSIRSKTKLKVDVAVVLGSGLGELATLVDTECILETSEIPHYPRSSVPGHAGRLLFGFIRDGARSSPPLLMLQGRVHYYECGVLSQVTFPIIIAAKLGVKKIILTNAAGGINSTFKRGDIMAIRDFINFSFLQVINRKPKSFNDTLTLRYPDRILYRHILQCAQDQKIDLREGTYCWVQGPSYETAAEIQMLKTLGADAVGMSTVPEILTALQYGLKVSALSLISNMGTGISHTKLSHQEVTETAEKAKSRFVPFLKHILLTLK